MPRAAATFLFRRICSSRPGDGEQRRQSSAALTARGRGLDCFQPQSQLPTARFSLAGSSLPPGRRARCARFPTCGVGRVAGYSVVWECISTSKFLQRAPKGALRPFPAAALLHYFSWCALEYSVVGRIPCYVSHDNTRTSVCQWPFAKKFLLLLLLNRIDSISNLYIFTYLYLYFIALDFPT